MKERKLNYRFHNPNPAADTADHILKVLIEANMGKAEQNIQAAVERFRHDEQSEKDSQ